MAFFCDSTARKLRRRIRKARLATKLVYLTRNPTCELLALPLLRFMSIDIPSTVQIGKNLVLEHGGVGVVIHWATEIGDDVTIHPHVTIGRADYLPWKQSPFQCIKIRDSAWIGVGAAILCKEGVLEIGKGAIVGANAVVLESVPENEVWAGVPAKCVGKRNSPIPSSCP
jgi:serine O-acetyltransferase